MLLFTNVQVIVCICTACCVHEYVCLIVYIYPYIDKQLIISYIISQTTSNTVYFPKWLISETLFIYTILETNRLELEKFHEGCVKFGEARYMGRGKRDGAREKKRQGVLRDPL